MIKKIKSLGDDLLAERERRGLTQEKCAAEMGINQSTVHHTENGRSPLKFYRGIIEKWIIRSRKRKAAKKSAAKS